MTREEILAEFKSADALLEGHFILSSGLRSPNYLQCARVLMNPHRAARLAEALAAKLPDEIRGSIEAVVSPAMGGVIIGHEMGRALGVDAMFLERPDGVFHLRRGFALEPGTKVLMVEDVVTTGLSSREAIKAIREEGGEVVAAASLVDRSGGTDLGVPFTPLIALDIPTYEPDSLPPELEAIEAIKPGSRKG
ncbi:orotate phosphoribosyltransferase [Sphingomicrobium clamense]|uniref:Orotate phosphoribosyltransferase n=1 Tax=Sphingomicrobium clamense TaxID=2851013 RepID=A0ABS6V2L1_9SPHN|nr:orotate phosphoribosyltransferase [Sphingomicrobium sp. B8]MBW0143766.1 orotate phosphoribosyltransferase [Sphingomicrobium sp. B8]